MALAQTSAQIPAMRLVQLRDADGVRRLAAVQTGSARWVLGVDNMLALAGFALEAGLDLAGAVAAKGLGETVDLAAALAEGRILAPIDHPDPAHLLMTGTGLTHLGSAESRDRMHAAAASGAMTDSMRMFRMGLEGGKPAPGETGVQPEWFYKGTGEALIGPGQALQAPDFAQDAGEEPEIAGVYLVDKGGRPRRLGFVLGNEFSDHLVERQNYLWLAHSKLRPAALGPELLLGPLPEDVRGTSRIRRGGTVLWEKPFLSGEANMSHSIANLEHHHFKTAPFRRPGGLHVHFFGTATLSFSDGVRTEPGDIFEIEADAFRLPLRNPLARAGGGSCTEVIPL
jgi:hypothetical protein